MATILALRSTRGSSLYSYSPECVEGVFSEIRLQEILHTPLR